MIEHDMIEHDMIEHDMIEHDHRFVNTQQRIRANALYVGQSAGYSHTLRVGVEVIGPARLTNRRAKRLRQKAVRRDRKRCMRELGSAVCP